jgi:transcriptional regulator with XRE-family HTH domain
MPSQKEKDDRLAFQKRLGNHIRKFRKASGLTQAQVSKLSHIKRNNIARIETGKENPSLYNLKRLAKGLKTDLSTLLKNI